MNPDTVVAVTEAQIDGQFGKQNTAMEELNNSNSNNKRVCKKRRATALINTQRQQRLTGMVFIQCRCI